MYAKKKKKPMYGKGGVIKYQNGGQGPDLESVMAYADALSNDGGGRFQKDLYDYLQILNRESREFGDEFSQRARDLYNDHFYRTAESASRDVTPENKRDASGIDRERVNKFYRDLFQSALSEDGHLAEVILDQANRREQRLLKNAVNREISDFKNSPEGKEAAQMAGPMMSLVNQYSKGGTVKYRSGGMMEYEQGGEVSREPKVDIIDNKVLVGGSMIKKQKPGGGFEYEPKPEYANEAMFYVDGVPATFADAKFAYEQTSDAGVGLDFNDYIEKYTKQRGAYDLDLRKQRESLRERAEAAGTPALLRALRDMR